MIFSLFARNSTQYCIHTPTLHLCYWIIKAVYSSPLNFGICFV